MQRFRQIQAQQDALEAEDRIRFLLIFAALLTQQGEQPAARQHLQQALTQLATLGYFYFLRFEAQRLLPFLQAWQKDLNDTVLQALIALASPEHAAQAQAGVTVTARPRLDVYGLGVGRAVRDDHVVPRTAWRAARARALFFFIVDRGSVRKEEIALTFWPDFSQAQISSNLHATLWRVRRALEDKNIIRVADGFYALHPDVRLTYDVRTFESLLARARQAHEEDRAALYQEAARLYQGDFLEDLDMLWIDERRHELQRLYRQTLEAVIDHWLAQNDCNEAMTWLARGLKIEPYYDSWHLQWMRCLVATGVPAAARTYYEAYRDRLYEELGIPPDERLTDFYRQIEKRG